MAAVALYFMNGVRVDQTRRHLRCRLELQKAFMLGARTKSPAFAKTVRKVSLAAICAGLIAGAAYWVLRPSCDADEPGFRGEVKREADGRLLYFDGHCWTTKPMPPTDTPF